MKMRNKKKKYKGMTLVEIIIALAIFAMLGALLVLAGVQIDKTMQASNKLKKKMLVEAPYAANQLDNYKLSDGATQPFATEPLTIEVKIGENAANVNGYLRDTEEIIKPGGMSDEEEAEYYRKANSRLNFKFIEIEEPTKPETKKP